MFKKFTLFVFLRIMAYELKMKTTTGNIVWYRPTEKNENKSCIILAPWFPHYFDKYHPFVNQIISQWLDLFITKYIWSRENTWEFTIWNTIKSVQDVINFIYSGSWESLFDNQIIEFNYNIIYLVWFSFGALPVLFTEHDASIKKILICPFIHHSFHMWWVWENINDTFSFVKKWYGNLYNYELENIINEIKSLDYNKSDKKSQYTLITGEYDKAIPWEEIDWLKANYNITHPFVSQSSHSIMINTDVLGKLFTNNDT